jgi:hypothetical protein
MTYRRRVALWLTVMALTGGALWTAGRLPAEEPSAAATPRSETAVNDAAVNDAATNSAAETDAPADDTVHELRTYITVEGRLGALHARFRDHTTALFEKHGMTNVMYWTPTDGEAAGNTLIYVLRHDSRQAADASWKAFRADPDWLAAKAASEADGPIVAEVKSVFMKTTEYSPR